MSTKAQPKRGRQRHCVPVISYTKGKRGWPKSGGHRMLWGINAALIGR